MSASKGNGIDFAEVVEVIPPEVVRYFVLRMPPSKQLFFDPGNGVTRLIDDFAELLAKPEKNPTEQKLIDISRLNLKPVVSSIPFSHLVASYQAALRDPETTIQVLKRTPEYAIIADKEQETIRHQLIYIQHWLDKWAPEETKFNIESDISHLVDSFSNSEKTYLQKLADKISVAPQDADGDWFHKTIYSFKESEGLTSQQLFGPLYRALINKPAGPRAGWFLRDLFQRDRDWLIKRLRLEV